MIDTKITIKNYRCFTDEPQEFSIRSGFISFIGVNNVGKSALLKLFYEFRYLWQFLADFNGINHLSAGNPREFNLLNINDSDDLFNYKNSKPIELGFQFSDGENTFEFTARITKRSTEKLLFTGSDLKYNGERVEFRQLLNSSQNSGVAVISVIKITPTENQEYKFPTKIINDFFDAMAKSIYLPAFRNIVNSGASNLYDISTGTAFVQTWNTWKNGISNSKRQKISKVTEDIKNLFNYDKLEISASEDKTTLILNINDTSHTLAEVGSGLAQFILTYASVLISSPSFVFIDEPELHLHPSLQVKFIMSLASYVTEGVIFSTHSVGLARSVSDEIYSIVQTDNGRSIKPFSSTTNLQTLLGELSFSSYREIGANAILLVEGSSDIKTMQEFLRKLGKDVCVLILSLGGCDMINGLRKDELSELKNRINIGKMYAWIDSEKANASDSISSNRIQFQTVCKELGIECGISDRRATENYFPLSAVKKAIGEDKVNLGDFDKLEKSKHWLKSQNWQIAMKTTKDELLLTDLGKFLQSINTQNEN